MLFLTDYSCKQASRLLSAAQDEAPAGLRQRLSLRWHLMVCTNCTNYRQQLDVLRSLVGDLAAGGDEPKGKP